ncbi:putative FMN-binding regulatory protein PaiB [Bradyrhizobium sp. LB11.1]
MGYPSIFFVQLECRLVVDQIEGQAKLNQHKSDADHVAVAHQLGRSEETGHRRLARKMQALRPRLGYDIL